ncbi:hypothetical protein [Salinibacterium sp. SWN1162]|uniref:hypothetical protein n=1 Tax=Salinibacterium sp. SWN1162 TaxID=2792053 RepID=UPI0018CE51ED|nr:hypothetical protein [Salinibacterium sp. SWN1162]MBH0009061.1 hypothetical protein [Salinibacterium sp. SWN1162]
MRLSNLTRLSIGALLVASLSGCVPADPAPPQPSATFVAPYASDEEALAAAEAAYGEFVDVSNVILNEGGASPERIETITTGDFAERTLSSYKDFGAEGKKSVGNATFDSAVLQRYSSGGGNVEIITIYLCHDVSKVDLLDSNGDSLVKPDRQARVRLEVTFDFDAVDQKLRLSERDVWTDPTC